MAERENTRTAEQEQDERAWIAALPRRHSFTQIMGWAVIFRACALTFLAQTWAKLSYSLQQIISAVIKIIYAMPWSYSLSNSKQHTHISQQTPASPADCCGPGSFPDQLQATAQYRKTPIAGEIVQLLWQMGSLTALQLDISMVSLNTGQPRIPSPSIVSAQEHSLPWDTS